MSSSSRVRPDMCLTASLALVALSFGCGPSQPAGRQQGGPPTRLGYYVAPAGTPAGNGSAQRPWDLQYALSGAQGRGHAGGTVWLRGGTYHGAFRTVLDGTAGRWIVFRQYPGERATIDGTLRADGSYLAFWGFEVMQSSPDTYGIQATTAHGRFINLIIHDAGTQGVSFWTPAVDAELYGCIIYNNGTHDNFDHGTYVHNEDGTKRITDNVFFNNLARGIQIYASPKNPILRNITVEGNVSFDNGTISTVVGARENLIFNAPVPTEGMVGIGNMLYFAGNDGINLRVGKYAPQNNHDIVLRDNYVAGGKIGLEMIEPWEQAPASRNTDIGTRDVVKVGGGSPPGHYQWSDNTWVRDAGAKAWRDEDQAYDWNGWKRASGLGASDHVAPEPPKETKGFVRPKRHEA